MRPRARHRFSAHTMLIIPSIPLPQQGLFYKKITFSTHFAGFQSFRYGSFSNILRRFYISCFKPCHSASSSIASRTVSAEKRNMAAHITHLKILHRVPLLFCSVGSLPAPGDSRCRWLPVAVLSHTRHPINRTFKAFPGIFAQKMLHPPKNGKVEHCRSGCFPALSGRRRIPAPHGRAAALPPRGTFRSSSG